MTRAVDSQTASGRNSWTPGYFQFMCLVALYTFVREDVDVMVLEVGIGGRLDATNVFDRPAVSGVATLDYDHMQVLGNTLPEIAREVRCRASLRLDVHAVGS